ncbi:MAG: rhodanese-like domain-containing protein, partial [Rhodospirillales bacterium]
DILVIDVRSPSQFTGKDGHIKDALNLPLIDLMGRIKQIKADLADYAETPVLVVCKTDQLSARAARILRKNGLTKVAVLAGGLKAWKKAGQPVTVA